MSSKGKMEEQTIYTTKPTDLRLAELEERVKKLEILVDILKVRPTYGNTVYVLPPGTQMVSYETYQRIMREVASK